MLFNPYFFDSIKFEIESEYCGNPSMQILSYYVSVMKSAYVYNYEIEQYFGVMNIENYKVILPDSFDEIDTFTHAIELLCSGVDLEVLWAVDMKEDRYYIDGFSISSKNFCNQFDSRRFRYRTISSIEKDYLLLNDDSELQQGFIKDYYEDHVGIKNF